MIINKKKKKKKEKRNSKIVDFALLADYGIKTERMWKKG